MCSVEKNTETSRFYHGLTARFNIYFNGYESYKAGLAKIRSSYKDDYAEILNVFESSDPASAKIATTDMERAIQKASKVISLKSITAKPEIDGKRDISEKDKKLLDRKEYNEWVDDSYLLIGKARFHKHEFTEATSVFNYSLAEANDPMIKEEARIWLARINNETGNFNESLRLLNEMEITREYSDGLSSMYYTTMADLFVKQKRYQEAIEPLRRGIEHVSGKRTRYRLTYLLAQLHEKTGSGAEATLLYRKVIKMNPPYEVEFNARINIAGVFDINSGNPDEMKRELQKMLRDSKNTEFHDQIYYSLGIISMKLGNEAEALEYFRKSASAMSQNPNQKGRSYLALADYFFGKPDYMKAAMYLDSAVFFLNELHPEYKTLKTRSQNLNELVSHLVVIEREDSLQRVASLSENERNALISTIISKVIKDESEGRSSDYTDRYNIGQYYENERRFQENIEQEGKWYFYNQAALTFGRTEFRRRWGDRKLEANWRRSNKARTTSTQTELEEGELAEDRTDTTAAAMDNKKPEFYLKDLPLTDSLKKISDEKIATALLNAGKAYSERMSDDIAATETLESLINRFTSSPLVPEALYYLFRINKENNKNKAEVYRQRLIQKYPDDEFSLILSDPDYYEKKMADIRETEKLYEQAYEAYDNERFDEAVTVVNNALAKYPENSLAPKFMLLHAFTIARTTDERTFKEDLNILTETFPGTPESKKAEEMIAYLNQKVPELKVEEDKLIAAELFIADTTVSRTFALIILDPSFNVNQATFDVISYNIDNYTNKNYRTEGTLIDNKFIMITVSGFLNYSQALSYFKSFDSQKPVRNMPEAKMMSFIISNDNMKVLLTDKNPERYDIFFRENYLK